MRSVEIGVVIEALKGKALQSDHFGAVLVGYVAGDRRPGVFCFRLSELGLSLADTSFAIGSLEDVYTARLYASRGLIKDPRPEALREIANQLSTVLCGDGSPWTSAMTVASIDGVKSEGGSVIVRIDVDPLLSDLPWEMIRIPGPLMSATIVRSVGPPVRAAGLTIEHNKASAPQEPVVLFLSGATVDTYSDLNDVVLEHKTHLDELFKSKARVVWAGDLETLEALLQDRQLVKRMVGLHFLGHGSADDEGPFLVCSADPSSSDPRHVYPEGLYRRFRSAGVPTLEWMLIAACRGGHAVAGDPIRPYATSGFAPQLTRLGVTNSALAMRFEVTPEFALKVSELFYRDFLNSTEPDVRSSYANARMALSEIKNFEAERWALSLFVNDMAGKQLIRWPIRDQNEFSQAPGPASSNTQPPQPSDTASPAPATASEDAGPIAGGGGVESKSPKIEREVRDLSNEVQLLMSSRRWDARLESSLRRDLDRLVDDIADDAPRRSSLMLSRKLLNMVHVPAGQYSLAAPPKWLDALCKALKERFGPDVETRVRQELRKLDRTVETRGFFADRFLVTREAFEKFCTTKTYKTTAERFDDRITWRSFPSDADPEYPVVAVSHEDAGAYATWAGKRLLSAEEWQILVRHTDGRFYPWGFEFNPRLCNTAENGTFRNLSVVHKFDDGVSELGCYDLVGNAEEWTSTKSSNGEGFLIFGGSWRMTCEVFSLPGFFRNGRPDLFTDDLGFRCAMDAPNA